MFMLYGKSLHLRTVKEGELEQLYSYFSSLRLRGEYLSSELVSPHLFRDEYLRTGFWGEDKGTLVLGVEDRVLGAIWFEKQNFLDCLDLHFYVFEKEQRNRGYMSEALGLFSKYLFATKKIPRLQISIPDYSRAAIRVAQKGGYQFEGIARSSFFHRGKYLDLCIYSLLRKECTDLTSLYE